MRKFLATCLIAVPFACGCAPIDSHTARTAQDQIAGFSKEKLFQCAGVPTKVQSIGPVEYDSYEYDATGAQSGSISLPLVGGVSLGSSGYCHATAKIVDDKVQEITYAGDTGSFIGHVANCAPIVSHCLDDSKEATGKY